jgi:putative ABC transport system permease protein
VKALQDTIGESQGIMNGVLIAFAGAIAFGVLYNAARIGLAEKRRVLASMEVLGFTKRESAWVLVSENLVIAVTAVLPGLLLGVLFCWLLTLAYDTEMYRFPFVIRGRTVLESIAVVVAFALLANASVWRRIARIDLVEVLKARE